MPEVSAPTRRPTARGITAASRAEERPDTASFFKSLGDMEREMTEMKAVYQKEIDVLVRQLDDMMRQKNYYAVQAEQHENYARELRKTLDLEMERSRSMADQTSLLQRALSNNEKDLQTAVANAAMATQSIEVHNRERRIDELLRETADLRKRLDSESTKRLEVEDKMSQLQQTMDFRAGVHERENEEARERFAAASRAILDLEERLGDLQSASRLQAAVLVDARDASARELARYKEETEESFGRTLAALKAQIEADNESFEKVANENRSLIATLAAANDSIKQHQGQIDQLRHQVKSLEESLSAERERAIKHARSLDNKLKDAQDMLFDKLQEINILRARSVPLWVSPDSTAGAHDTRSRMVVIPPIVNKAGGTTTVPTKASCQTEDASGCDGRASRAGLLSCQPLAADQLTARSGRLASASAYARCASADKGNPDFVKSHQSIFSDACGSQQGLHKQIPLRRAPSSRPISSVSHDYNNCTSSATGDIKIQEVHEEGRYIRLFNEGKKDLDIGNYTLQQNVGGNPVAVYQFPPRLMFLAGTSVTVFSGCNDQMLHQPPASFVWKEQERWGYGPECTTILCKANGQAVAWMTATHRFGRIALNSDKGQSRDDLEFSTNKFCADSEAEGLSTRPDSASSRRSDGLKSTPEAIKGQPLMTEGDVQSSKMAAMRHSAGSKAAKGAVAKYGQPSPFSSPLQLQFAKACEERSTSLVHFA